MKGGNPMDVLVMLAIGIVSFISVAILIAYWPHDEDASDIGMSDPDSDG